MSTTVDTTGTVTDFDFLTGRRHVDNRRLVDFLDPDSGWEEFPGITHASRHFAGGANFDEIEFPTLASRGLTLRLYDIEREQWSLYWSSSRTGVLFPPAGEVDGGRAAKAEAADGAGGRALTLSALRA